jgi:hypothetical protein
MKWFIILPFFFSLTSLSSAQTFYECNKTDSISFIIDELLQYYQTGLEYKGGLKKVKSIFLANYRKPKSSKKETGYLTIRFMVNCKCELGKFEFFELSSSYHSYSFSKAIKDQLLDITKSLNDWKLGYYPHYGFVDSYKFFTFKIVEGEIVDIIPK